MLIYLNIFHYKVINAIQVKEDVNESTTDNLPILQTNKDNDSGNNIEGSNLTLNGRQITKQNL